MAGGGVHGCGQQISRRKAPGGFASGSFRARHVPERCAESHGGSREVSVKLRLRRGLCGMQAHFLRQTKFGKIWKDLKRFGERRGFIGLVDAAASRPLPAQRVVVPHAAVRAKLHAHTRRRRHHHNHQTTTTATTIHDRS